MVKIFFILLFLLIIPKYLISGLIDNSGKEFVICFPKNDEPSNLPATLRLYAIPVENPNTIISVETFLNGNQIQEYYTIGKEYIEIDFPIEFEVQDNSENEKKGIIIKSDYDIVLIGISYKLYTADAFLSLPISTLDTEYVIASWFNLIKSETYNGANRFSDCTIVGIYDSTLVEFTPSDKIRINSTDSKEIFTFTINKGETRMIEAGNYGNFDLTASFVKANKKIAIISGHQRASIPANLKQHDVLIEFTPPVSCLGLNAIFTATSFPNFKPKSYARIIAAFDSTKVEIGSFDTIINKFQKIDYFIDKPFLVKTNKPTLFAQYERSIIFSGNGDPFLAFQAPVEQYLNKYAFISTPMEEFTEHWVNITIKKEGITTLLMDGSKLDDSLFENVSGSDYYWAAVKVGPGVHKMSSDSVFGILVYGYGIAISYGYTGGLKTERLLEKIMDGNQPQMNKKENCSTFLEITENNEYDSGIDVVSVKESENVTVSISPFQKGDKLVSINLSLLDEKDDGFAIINTKDIKGYERTDTLYLNGFRISLNYDSYTDSLFYLDFQCDTIRLKNEGKAVSTFTFYFEDNTKISIPSIYYDMTLKSGQDTLIPLCIHATDVGNILDKLILRDNCDRENDFEIKYSVESLTGTFDSRCGLKLEFIVATDIRSMILDKSIDIKSIIRIFDLLGSEVYSGTIDNFSNNLTRGIYCILTFEENKLTNRFIINFE